MSDLSAGVLRPPPAVPSEARAPRARTIAFYLPQYHPVPENNEWWGPGFTEWTVAARARPLFRGHHQPNIPGALGYYDLRLPETRSAQAELARSHGVSAFCYWHYWFGGRRMLERPFDEVLASGEPDFPFCLGWANENWTSIWVGRKDRTLVAQTYPGPADMEAHFRYVARAFADPRYLRVDGRPLFFVHRPDQLPDAAGFTDEWRRMAASEGLPGIYFVGESRYGWPVVENGFDAQVRTPLLDLEARPLLARWRTRVMREVRRGPFVYPYAWLAKRPWRDVRSPGPQLPMILSNWDNTPRHGRRGFVLQGSTPERFGGALRAAVDAVADLPSEERIVFVKSWNEWAEGNYIEPDRRWGTGYLEAVAEVLLSEENVTRHGRGLAS